MSPLAINVLETTSVLFPLPPLIAGIIYLRNLDRAMKLLVLEMAVAAISDITSKLLADIFDFNYSWVHHIYVPIEYALFMLILSKWTGRKSISRLLIFSVPIFIVLSVFISLFIQGIRHMNNYMITLSMVIYALASLYILYGIMTENSGDILKDHRFWVVTGLLLFSSGDLAYFSLHKVVREEYLIAIWAIHIILNILSYIFYFTGIICQGRNWSGIEK